MPARFRSGIDLALHDRMPSKDFTDASGMSWRVWNTVPVSGAVSTELGGLRSADIGLTMQYADVNQPQTISAPKTLRPYSEFTSKVQSFVQSLQGSVGSSLLPGATGGSSGSSGPGSSGSGSSGSSASGKLQRYSNCLTAAGSDVAKMQRCASLLNAS